MKKSHLSMAVLIALSAGVAHAQSSVTLFGVVDTGLVVGKGSVANRTQLAPNSLSSSRLGFRGVEDLGGGMSASFWLETGISTDDGKGVATNTNNQASGAAPAGQNGGQGLTFNRRSTVSLSGTWGEVRVGRDFTPQYQNLVVFDQSGNNGVGTGQTINSIITGVTSVRASNAIGYFLPSNIGGFYGQAQYYLGENPSNAGATKKDGTGYGVRLGYSKGPFNAAISVSKTDYAAGDVQQNNVGASWDFGVAKVMGHVSRDKAGPVNGAGWLLGTQIPVGPGEIRVGYSQYRTDLVTGPDPKSQKVALGYVHNLSKRTALYATYAHLRNSGGAASALNGSVTAANASSSGYDLGIRHIF
jgi:predicted porin